MTPPADPGIPSRIPPTGAMVLRWEGALKGFCRARPRAAAMTAFALLMAMLLSVYSVSPGEARFTGDLRGTTLLVNGVPLAGAEVTVWPAGKFEVTVRREGHVDVSLRAEVQPLSRVVVEIPAIENPDPESAPAAVAAKEPPPPAPLTEEEIVAEVEALERASDDQLLATVPATDRDASLARSAATRAFARCRASGKFDRSVLVFAPACAWARLHPETVGADPWDAAAAAADLAPPEAAARAALCLARLALALGRFSDSRALFEKTASEARRQANDGDLEGAVAVTREALALSPPDGARSKLERLLAQCLEASR